MRLPRHFAVPMFLLLSASAATPRTTCAAPDVRLSEILAGPARDWDGSGAVSSRDDEWIEIVNGGSGTTDLARASSPAATRPALQVHRARSRGAVRAVRAALVAQRAPTCTPCSGCRSATPVTRCCSGR